MTRNSYVPGATMWLMCLCQHVCAAAVAAWRPLYTISVISWHDSTARIILVSSVPLQQSSSIFPSPSGCHVTRMWFYCRFVGLSCNVNVTSYIASSQKLKPLMRLCGLLVNGVVSASWLRGHEFDPILDISSSRMRFMNHNWSATKQRLHPQSVAEISHHSVLSGDRIRQCETSSGSRHKDTDKCLIFAISFCRHRNVPVPCEISSAETTVAERGPDIAELQHWRSQLHRCLVVIINHQVSESAIERSVSQSQGKISCGSSVVFLFFTVLLTQIVMPGRSGLL